MSNYIFVDIDGPLLPTKMHLFPENRIIQRSKLNEALPKFDPFAVKCFNLWAKYADAEIIFSTNWATALYPDADEKLKVLMANNDLDFEGRYHEDVLTPKKFSSARGSEIWWWLVENAKDGDRFIAVDDDYTCGNIKDYMRPRKQDQHYPSTMVKPDITGKWIEVEFTDGLTMRNFLDGCDALDINLDEIDEQEFGIKALTQAEKDKRDKALELLANCII